MPQKSRAFFLESRSGRDASLNLVALGAETLIRQVLSAARMRG